MSVNESHGLPPKPASMRTPLGRVRALGASHSGTSDFWRQRVTAVAMVLLIVPVIAVVMMLHGSNQAGAAQILGSPLVAVIMLLFVICIVTHMKIGMQEILVDYIADDSMKLTFLLANTFFCWAVGLICAYAILKMSSGV